ncbi:LysR substrate-binding domain-containing protein [Acinetobacter baumannii]|uniref:LysR substrate-binding domain-containing protein n=1 Tax=Acinetobacter baumannii TaxID=470 RepID=UPI003D10390E
MNLEVRWVEDLLTLERERSISKAAEKRFISQSASTRRIQQIEEMIGAEVIIRNNKNNIEFTDIGRILLVMSKNIEKQVEETAKLIKNIKNETESTIRFCVVHSLASGFLTTFLKKFPTLIRDLKIEIVATNSGEGLSLLKEGACDFMICYADKSNIRKVGDDILSGIKIAETVIVPVSATEPDHSPKHTIQSNFALLAYSKHAYLRKLVDQLIEGKLVYKTLYETDNATNLKELVLQGLGVAWIPKINVEEDLAAGKLVILDQQEYCLAQDIYIFKNNLSDNKSVQKIWNGFKGQQDL